MDGLADRSTVIFHGNNCADTIMIIMKLCHWTTSLTARLSKELVLHTTGKSKFLLLNVRRLQYHIRVESTAESY